MVYVDNIVCPILAISIRPGYVARCLSACVVIPQMDKNCSHKVEQTFIKIWSSTE